MASAPSNPTPVALLAGNLGDQRATRQSPLRRGGRRLWQDQTFSGAGDAGEQLRLGLPEFAGAAPRKRPRPRYRCRPVELSSAPDPLLTLFEQRLAARARAATVSKYLWAIRDVLRLAERLRDGSGELLDLLNDTALLGRVFATDEGRGGAVSSRWTIAHRRTALRSLATLLKPELTEALGRDPDEVIREALRGVAERVAGGYRIVSGAPRQRGGSTPSGEEVEAILGALGRRAGWDGHRDRTFVLLLTRTASRVNALRTLDGTDCHVMPDGRVRLMLPNKNAREPHEVELDQESAAQLRLYVATYNRAMRIAGCPQRIVLGEPGPIWRGERGRCWPEAAMRRTLRRACQAAGGADYTPHAFRRFWATCATERLPRWEAALAGGWQGTERFDDHYVTPSRSQVWGKLGRLAGPIADVGSPVPALVAEARDATTVAT